MVWISKIRLVNYRRFKDIKVPLNQNRTIFIGDNESGKSTILEAISLVLSGSKTKVQNLGLDCLFNSEVVDEFQKSDKAYAKLPRLLVEVFLKDIQSIDLDGKNNSDKTSQCGLKLEIFPDEEYAKEIAIILSKPDSIIPFEFYEINFTTFADQSYNGYKKYLSYLLIDNTHVNSEYAMREYVKEIFRLNANELERNLLQNDYRKFKEHFKSSKLQLLNNKFEDFEFVLKSGSADNLESDLTVAENQIRIENRGKGHQSIVKTKLALNKNGSKSIPVLLFEEPENHLSHMTMRKLIDDVENMHDNQLIIATHSSLIAASLELRYIVMLNSTHEELLSLKDLDSSTSRFFVKAPNHNVLEFVLSKKVILVEGPSEFILMPSFFKSVYGSSLENANVNVISVGGISFKPYLEIAKVLSIKTAIIRDNDRDHNKKCVVNYSDYDQYENIIKVFSEINNDLTTFEKSLFEVNEKLCSEVFGRSRLNPLDYMLKNKTDAALALSEVPFDQLVVPRYIQDAIKWISE